MSAALPGGIFLFVSISKLFCEILGFCRKVDENYSFLGYYVARSGSFLPTFRNNLPAGSDIRV
jgi:hypothetical protein